MQQPDNRDQSEQEVKGQTEESGQSDSSEKQNQETNQTEQEEKETDDAVVGLWNYTQKTAQLQRHTMTLHPI